MSPCVRALMPCLATSFLLATVIAQPSAGSATPNPLQPEAELERGPKQERKIALTFDADGGNEELGTLLRVLENEDILATFFLTGRWAAAYPTCAVQIVEHGHVIGNHTWGHKDLTKLTDSEIGQELLRVDDRFVSAFGCRYLPLFRAPSGEEDARILAVAGKLGFRTVRWSVDTLDSMEPRKTASFIENRVLGLSDEELCGAIVLMHVGYAETCAALPVIIHNLRERGFEFVPVSTWIPQLQPSLAKFRTSAASQDYPSVHIGGMSCVTGLHADEQAMKTVLSASSALAPEHQILRSWHRWTGPSGGNVQPPQPITKP